ncbi:hypothetical protein R1sor_003330 [Riccia sorocarpa]|uniref:TCP domain-containing protein n=1 Tax=Riccia sorocarpa TaxID=122646 RepID=A0ABD3H197_9MARC
MHFFPPEFVRSTSWRIDYQSSLGQVEGDLKDFCERPCPNLTGYLQGAPFRGGNLPQSECSLLEPKKRKFDDQGEDADRFQLTKRAIENQIGEHAPVQDCSVSTSLGDQQAALANSCKPWSASPSASGASQSIGDLGRHRVQKPTIRSLINQQLQSSSNSFEALRSFQTPGQKRLILNAECQGERESQLTWTLGIEEEVSDIVIGVPSLKRILPQLVESRRPGDFSATRLDSIAARSTRSRPSWQRDKSISPSADNVVQVSSGSIVSPEVENVVECGPANSAGDGYVFGFPSEVSCSQVSYCKGNESLGELGNLIDYQRELRPDSPEESQVLPRSSSDFKLGNPGPLASGRADRDALGIQSFRKGGSDHPRQESVPAQVIRALERPLKPRIVSEGPSKERGYQYPLRGAPVSTGTTNPDRSRGGDTPFSRGENHDAVFRREGLLVIPKRFVESPGRILTGGEIVEIPENDSIGERGAFGSYRLAEEGTGGSAESFTIRERISGSPSEGNKIPETPRAGSDRDSGGKGPEKRKDEKLHSRLEEGQQRPSEPSSDERRLRPRLDGSSGGGSLGSITAADETSEGPKMVRPARPSGGKDRHSKVNTAKGPRDRRVRLSVPTAVQFYDVQDRLGFDQPSKAVEWLIHKAKDAIDELGRLPIDGREGSRTQQGLSSSTTLDMSHRVLPAAPSSYNAAVSAGLVAGSASSTATTAPTSFQGPSSSNPYTDQLSLFMDPAVTKGMFATLHPNQGSFAGPNFGLGRGDDRSDESLGSPLARMDSRVKARERARERVKKSPGDTTVSACGGSPSSSQSPPFPSSFSSFSGCSSMQASAQVLSFGPSSNQNPFLPGVYEGSSFPGIMPAGSHQGGPFQGLNQALDSQFCSDQNQSPLPNAFEVQRQASSQIPSHAINSLQPQHLHAMQGALNQLGSTFHLGLSSSSFAEGSGISSHYPSVSSHPLSHLSMLGMSPAGVSSLGSSPYNPTGTPTPIPPGFSPGPPASAFRGHSLTVSHGSNQNQQQQQQQQLQEDSRVHRPVLSFSAAHPISSSPAGSSRGLTQPYYLGTPFNALIGSIQSLPSERLNPPSRSSLSYDPAGLQRTRSMASHPTANPYQPISSSQIPARIQGLDDVKDRTTLEACFEKDIYQVWPSLFLAWMIFESLIISKHKYVNCIPPELHSRVF